MSQQTAQWWASLLAGPVVLWYDLTAGNTKAVLFAMHDTTW